MTTHRYRLLAAAAATFAFGFATTSANADPFSIKSATFAEGKMMPKKVANSTANVPTNPNCVGDNVSPEFSFSNVPDGTKSFIFLMSDPEGRGGAGVSHFVFYGIPASVTGFAEGELGKSSDKFVGGKATPGTTTYFGPCTPPGQVAHHYTFVLIATDFDPKEMAPGMTRDEVLAKIAAPGTPPAHTKGVAGMVGLFVNPWHE